MIARAGRSTSDATNGQRRGKAPTQRALASTFEVTKQDVDPLLRKNLHQQVNVFGEVFERLTESNIKSRQRLRSPYTMRVREMAAGKKSEFFETAEQTEPAIKSQA